LESIINFPAAGRRSAAVLTFVAVMLVEPRDGAKDPQVSTKLASRRLLQIFPRDQFSELPSALLMIAVWFAIGQSPLCAARYVVFLDFGA
jgi:hypothetical protein